MGACYATDATFEDPVFQLSGPMIGAMWRMLCDRGRDLQIQFRDVLADDGRGSARWEAWYTFTVTGRPVHNAITAAFAFRAGKIVRHVDKFSLYRWSGQALGPKGWLLGWARPVRGAIRAQAAKSLDRYVQEHGLDHELS